jgi:hypothetical protein
VARATGEEAAFRQQWERPRTSLVASMGEDYYQCAVDVSIIGDAGPGESPYRIQASSVAV